MTRTVRLQVVLGVVFGLVTAIGGLIIFMHMKRVSGQPGALREPGGSLRGTWCNREKAAQIQFLPTGEVEVQYRYKVPAGADLPKLSKDLRVELGFSLLEFNSAVKRSLRGRGDRTRTEVEIEVLLGPAGKVVPWSKVAFRTDDTGRPQLIREDGGKQIAGYGVMEGRSLVVQIRAAGSTVPSDFDQVVLEINYLDTELNWTGKLSVRSHLRPVGMGRHQVYIPVQSSSENLDVILGELSVAADGAQVSVQGGVLDFPSGTYVRASNSGEPCAAAVGPLMSMDTVPGVEVADGVFVNTGSTIGRGQNVRFKLPRSEAVPAPMPEKKGHSTIGPGGALFYGLPTDQPVLLIRKGAAASEARRTKRAYSHGVAEPGQVHCMYTRMSTLGANSFSDDPAMAMPFRIEQAMAFSFRAVGAEPTVGEPRRGESRDCYEVRSGSRKKEEQ